MGIGSALLASPNIFCEHAKMRYDLKHTGTTWYLAMPPRLQEIDHGKQRAG